jgi:CRISPR-associated endonuclease/helicase Cas3
LVEHATHLEALHAIEVSLGEEWRKIGQAIDGDTGARHVLARLHAIPYDAPFSNISFPDSDQKIATRLGAADRLIEFTPPQPGPFGQEVIQMALRFHQVPAGLSPDAQPTDIAVFPGRAGFEFALGPARYRYSRLGLERLKADDLPLATSGDPA